MVFFPFFIQTLLFRSMARGCAISRGAQRAEACGEIIDEIAEPNERAHDDDGCTVIEQSSSAIFLNL
jgi:hypothetical protein